MKPSLAPGIHTTHTKQVASQDITNHLGGPQGVFSTPSMIGWMEDVAMKLALQHLDAGENSVGVLVNIEHLGAVLVDEPLECRAELVAKEGKKLTFALEVWHIPNTGEGRLLGKGQHARMVINVERFLKRLFA